MFDLPAFSRFSLVTALPALSMLVILIAVQLRRQCRSKYTGKNNCTMIVGTVQRSI